MILFSCVRECQGEKHIDAMLPQFVLRLLERDACRDDIIDQDRIDPLRSAVAEIPWIVESVLERLSGVGDVVGGEKSAVEGF